jgi:lipopolysaccharide export system protein LptA
MSIQSTKLNKWLLCLLLINTLPNAYALNTDVEKPVEIEADTAVFDKNAGTANYDGNVIVKQGTLEILAAHVDILAPDSEIQHITAKGSPVNFKQDMEGGKQAKGTALEIQYFVKEKRITLQGNAELLQDQDKLTGHFMEYLPENGQLTAKGEGSKSGRISATFYPTNKADGTSAKPAPKPTDTKTDKKAAE